MAGNSVFEYIKMVLARMALFSKNYTKGHFIGDLV
jgi:hypothetical protein